MKFSEYIQKQADEFRRAGDGYEALSNTSKACIDFAVQRYVDEYAAKQQAIAFITWAIDGTLQGDNYGGVSFSLPLDPDNAEQAYNQFIEQQQNK